MANNFSSVGDILNNTVFGASGFKRGLRQATAFQFWPNIVGNRFVKFSKPYDFKGAVLYVVCKNATVVQELLLFKADIIKKASMYFEPLDMKIQDIRFEYKTWREGGGIEAVNDDYIPFYTEEELNEIQLSIEEEKELDELAKSLESIDFMTSKLRDKIRKDVLNQIRARKLRKNNTM